MKQKSKEGERAIKEEYKKAVREYLTQRSEFNRGRMFGLSTSLGCFKVSIAAIDEMFHSCEEVEEISEKLVHRTGAELIHDFWQEQAKKTD